MARPDYTEFYRPGRELGRLLLPRDLVVWHERATPPEQACDTVVNLTCTALWTPQIIRETVDVLRILGVDHVAVTGVQFCCGVVQYVHGDFAQWEALTRSVVPRLERYRPRRVVLWGGTCYRHFEEVLRKRFALGFTTALVSEVLLERVRALGDRIPWRKAVPIRAAVHEHHDFPLLERDSAAIRQLLRAVPGVQLAGAVQAPALGAPCYRSGSLLAGLSPEQVQALQADLEAQVQSLAADTIITPRHTCQREWGKLAGAAFSVRHFVSVLAEALDCAQPDTFQTYWKLGDTAAIVAQARHAWESWGLTEQQARRIAARYFPPQPEDWLDWRGERRERTHSVKEVRSAEADRSVKP